MERLSGAKLTEDVAAGSFAGTIADRDMREQCLLGTAGLLYRPDGPGPFPAMVLLHG